MPIFYQFTVPPAGDYNYWNLPVETGCYYYPAGECFPTGAYWILRSQ